MLEYNQIKPKTYIELDGSPFEVLSSHVFRKQQRKPVNQTKLRNLITGKVIDHSFGGSEKAEEATIEKTGAVFIYRKENRQTNNQEYWFHSKEDPSDRFFITEKETGGKEAYLKENDTVTLAIYKEQVIGIELPIKMTFTVTEAPPNVKGNSATGSNKVVTLETGTTLTTPLFIEVGEQIVVNTETGEYVERAKL